jgi:Fe/S biogenesis protein NfuA
MLRLTETAEAHFRRLLEREAIPGLGVRLGAIHPGTSRADVRLEFAEAHELDGDEWSMQCDGFTLWVEAGSIAWLDGAEIDYTQQGANGQLQIRAPRIKGMAPAADAPLAERVQWVIEHDINPQLAQHRGHVRVESVVSSVCASAAAARAAAWWTSP